MRGESQRPNRRTSIVEEIRALLGLPWWSNLRGDDVIDLIAACDEPTRLRLLDLYVALRELDDAAGRPVDSYEYHLAEESPADAG